MNLMKPRAYFNFINFEIFNLLLLMTTQVKHYNSFELKKLYFSSEVFVYQDS